jgi:hypothetical protein
MDTVTRTANTKRHHERLHKPSSFNDNRSGTKKKNILKMMSVQIRGPKATANVVAFIDDGSNITILDCGLNRFEWRMSPFMLQLDSWKFTL